MKDVLNPMVANYAIKAVIGWIEANPAVAIGAVVAALALAASRRRSKAKPDGT